MNGAEGMLERLLVRLVLAAFIFFSVTGLSSPGSSSPERPSSKDTISPGPAQPEPGQLLLPDKVVDQGAVSLPLSLPQRGILLALSRWGSTTLALFDISRKELIPLATKATGELLVSFAAGKLAYLEREGVNPAKNSVEVLDLKGRRSQRIKAADDFAILGFSVSPSGEHLAYAQINLRWSRSHRVSWRSGTVELKGLESRISLTSGQNNLPGGEIPVPFAWSGRTGEVYLQGLLPFRGMVNQGTWAMMPNGSGLRRILSEPSYTGLPRLSPDGAYLAYLSTKIEALPRDYIPRPGAPPGNILAVTNLLNGEQDILAQEVGSVFGAFSWSATGKEILVSHQEWLEGRFRDAAFRRVRKDSSLQLRKIAGSPSLKVTGIAECNHGSFFWVEEDKAGARLLEDKGNGIPATPLALPEGKIQLIGCFGERGP